MAKILFVDDEELVRRVIVRVLNEQHECTTTSSHQHALALLAQGKVFDVIFCDMRMRGTAGCDFATALRSRFFRQADRVVMVSGDCYRLHDCQQSCAHFILAKPFTVQDLTRTIEQVLSTSDRRSAPCPLVQLPTSPERIRHPSRRSG